MSTISIDDVANLILNWDIIDLDQRSEIITSIVSKYGIEMVQVIENILNFRICNVLNQKIQATTKNKKIKKQKLNNKKTKTK